MQKNLAVSTLARTQNALDSARDRLAQQGADDRGAAMAEYGLLLALIALVAVVVMREFGAELLAVFTESRDEIRNR